MVLQLYFVQFQLFYIMFTSKHPLRKQEKPLYKLSNFFQSCLSRRTKTTTKQNPLCFKRTYTLQGNTLLPKEFPTSANQS